MRKIKFKTEYVPLSDEVINAHKNFDQLMAAYVVAPKPNWFKQFIQKKWTMFGGGLMTGAIITSLLWYNQDIKTVEQPVTEQAKIENEIQDSRVNNTVAIVDSSVKNTEGVTTEEDSGVGGEMSLVNGKPEADNFENSIIDKTASSKSSSGVAAKSVSESSQSNAENNKVVNGISDEQHDAPALVVAEESKESETVLSGEIKKEEAGSEVALSESEKIDNDVNNQVEATAESQDEIILPSTSFISNDDSINKEHAVAIGPPFYIAADTSNQSAADIQEEKNNSALPGIVAGAAIAASPDMASASPDSKQKKEKNNKEKSQKDSGEYSSGNAFLNLKLFDRDTTKHATTNDGKKAWFVFGKDSAKNNYSSGELKDSSVEKSNAAKDVNQDSLYIPRYAQVSFITPLSSNGIDGYKYMHFVSLNVLQGYNGAVKGAEFGGLLNGVKGYVTGAQFAGLGNYAGGNLKGAQFAGLANTAESVQGAQFAGITNVSGGIVSGFQAAGVVNVSPDSLNGVQIAGVVNVLSSEKKSQSWQVAGVGNVSLAESKGGQIGGVFNVANKLAGGQIGLINFGKNIKGFQIGLINISDSIDGAPIGLISVSASGIFDANIWSSDFLAINGGVRVGSKYVYNIYSYGVSPFHDDLPFGFGVGIGGHIPISKKFFMDIDGMAWSMHRSYISFSRINMINQLRVMGGFTINKYLSVFAGPTLNISVQDNRYEPFLSNYFFENISENTTVRLAPGFVVGLQVF